MKQRKNIKVKTDVAWNKLYDRLDRGRTAGGE
jgi:hypothetical protein